MSYKQKPVEQKQPNYTIRIKRLIEAYDKANLEYVLTPDDTKEMQFFNAATNINPDLLQEFIPNVYRLKTNKRFLYGQVPTDEVIVFYSHRTCQLFSGKHIEDHRMHEYIWNPISRANRNAEGQSDVYTIIRYEPLFFLPFTKKAVEELQTRSITGITNLYVGTASRSSPDLTTGDIFAIRNIEDFKNGTWQELMDMGRFNYSTTESVLEDWRSEGDSIKKTSRSLLNPSNVTTVIK